MAHLKASGLSQNEIARRLGLSKATIAYHMRRLGEPVDDRCNRRYDWAEVQRFSDQGHSISECLAHFGCARKTFYDACRRGAIVTRPHGMPLEELLARPRNRMHLKARLVRLGLKTEECERCGIADWRGAPLSLALHHINGQGQDNRLANLQLLCPNCHSQTDTFAGRNRGRGTELQAARRETAG